MRLAMTKASVFRQQYSTLDYSDFDSVLDPADSQPAGGSDNAAADDEVATHTQVELVEVES